MKSTILLAASLVALLLAPPAAAADYIESSYASLDCSGDVQGEAKTISPTKMGGDDPAWCLGDGTKLGCGDGTKATFTSYAKAGTCAQTTTVACTDATTAGCQSKGSGFEDACAALNNLDGSGADSGDCLAVDSDSGVTGNVQCADMPAGDFCDCGGDCGGSYCRCDEALACCAEEATTDAPEETTDAVDFGTDAAEETTEEMDFGTATDKPAATVEAGGSAGDPSKCGSAGNPDDRDCCAPNGEAAWCRDGWTPERTGEGCGSIAGGAWMDDSNGMFTCYAPKKSDSGPCSVCGVGTEWDDATQTCRATYRKCREDKAETGRLWAWQRNTCDS